MRKKAIFATFVIAIALTLTNTLHAQEAKKGTTTPSRWYDPLGVFGTGKSKSESKKSRKAKTSPSRPKITPEIRRAAIEGKITERERKAFERRMECCLKIREIAEQIGDTKLLQKAAMLEERAWRVFVKRTPGQLVLVEGSGENGQPIVRGGERYVPVENPR